MQTFEFREMVKVVGISETKAKNWIVGRPFKIEASVHTATGQGSRNLYSLDDVYLMAVANELSRSGMAAKAIGDLVGTIKTRFPKGLGQVDSVTLWRNPKHEYKFVGNGDRPLTAGVVSMTIDIGRLRNRITERMKDL